MNKELAISQLMSGMSKMAETHSNDVISNALASTAYKLETYGATFGSKLNDTDKMMIRYYHKNK